MSSLVSVEQQEDCSTATVYPVYHRTVLPAQTTSLPLPETFCVSSVTIIGSSLVPLLNVVLCDLIVELLERVLLESHEYMNEILPTIQQSYKDVGSKAQFLYTRPRLVHNSRLQDNVSHS